MGYYPDIFDTDQKNVILRLEGKFGKGEEGEEDDGDPFYCFRLTPMIDSYHKVECFSYPITDYETLDDFCSYIIERFKIEPKSPLRKTHYEHNISYVPHNLSETVDIFNRRSGYTFDGVFCTLLKGRRLHMTHIDEEKINDARETMPDWEYEVLLPFVKKHNGRKFEDILFDDINDEFKNIYFIEDKGNEIFVVAELEHEYYFMYYCDKTLNFNFWIKMSVDMSNMIYFASGSDVVINPPNVTSAFVNRVYPLTGQQFNTSRFRISPRCDQQIGYFAYPVSEYLSLEKFREYIIKRFNIQLHGEGIKSEDDDRKNFRQLLNSFYNDVGSKHHYDNVPEGPWVYTRKSLKTKYIDDKKRPKWKTTRERKTIEVTRLDFATFNDEIISTMTEEEKKEDIATINFVKENDGKDFDSLILKEYTEEFEKVSIIAENGNETYIVAKYKEWYYFFAYNGS